MVNEGQSVVYSEEEEEERWSKRTYNNLAVSKSRISGWFNDVSGGEGKIIISRVASCHLFLIEKYNAGGGRSNEIEGLIHMYRSRQTLYCTTAPRPVGSTLRRSQRVGLYILEK